MYRVRDIEILTGIVNFYLFSESDTFRYFAKVQILWSSQSTPSKEVGNLICPLSKLDSS